MIQAAWIQVFNSLLNNAVFEKEESFKQSITVSTLTTYCACLIQYKRFIVTEEEDDFNQYLKNIWNHFYTTRTIYLNSTQQSTANNLKWLERVYFTSFL
jgi:hypothetical protein